jgi:hypothetical protein
MGRDRTEQAMHIRSILNDSVPLANFTICARLHVPSTICTKLAKARQSLRAGKNVGMLTLPGNDGQRNAKNSALASDRSVFLGWKFGMPPFCTNTSGSLRI